MGQLRKSVAYHGPMMRTIGTFGLLLLLAATAPTVRAAQGPVTEASDLSGGVVAELATTTVVVERDGSSTTDVAVRLRVPTDASVARAGTVSIPFARESSTVEIAYVRVRKPDGRVVDTPASSAIDVQSEATQEEPIYSDSMIRKVNVRGLAAGDVLEYAAKVRTRPLLPGHFYFEDESIRPTVVEDGWLTVSAPDNMFLNVKTRGDAPIVTRSNGRQIYRWTATSAKATTSTDLMTLARDRRYLPAHIQVSSFHSWAELGDAVRVLWKGRAEPTAAVRQKALEVTNGASTDEARVQALYAFVSGKIRYVGLQFGVGRLQPHTAEEVLDNGFGDCKDKHILLEALLSSVGVNSTPALIGVDQHVDPDVPSPAQFNHVVTRVDLAAGPLWVDATVSAAYAGYLTAAVRDRQALAVPARVPASLASTPRELPRPNRLTITLEARVDLSQGLLAHLKEEHHGDSEVLLRLALRQLSEAERRAAITSAVESWVGPATSTAVSGIDDPTVPIIVIAEGTKPREARWARGEITLPLPSIAIPDVATGGVAPISLLSTEAQVQRLTLELPAGFEGLFDGQPSFEASEKTDFGEYHLLLKAAGSAVTVERTLTLSVHELPRARAEEFRVFRDAVIKPLPVLVIKEAWPWTSTSALRAPVPDGKNAEATRLLAQARTSVVPVAIQLYQRVVELEPTHPAAWALLGGMQMLTNDRVEGEKNLRRQIEVAPSAFAYKTAASSLLRLTRTDDAVTLLREGASRFPDDRDMPALLGETLVGLARFADALPVIQAEAARRPRSSRLQLDLGRALAGTGQPDLGVAALKQAAVLEAGPNIWSAVARELARMNRESDLALDYAQRAIARTNAENAAAELQNPPAGYSNAAGRMAYYYETLGQVLIRRGDYGRARSYCMAAWEMLVPTGTGATAAGCVATAARGSKDTETAAKYEKLSTAMTVQMQRSADFQRRGPGSLGPVSASEAEALTVYGKEMERLQTFSVPRPAAASGNGFVDFLVGPDGRIRQARSRALGGAPTLDTLVPTLVGLKVAPALPEDGTARLFLSGLLVCSPAPAPSCTFRLTLTPYVAP